MIFTAEETRLVLTGRKTQTRRLAGKLPGMPAPSLDLTENERLHTTRHRVGDVIALERHARGDELTPEQRMRINTRAKRSTPPAITVGHVRCTDLRLQRLGDLDLVDARGEGFRTTDDFRAAWVARRDTWGRRMVAEATLSSELILANSFVAHFDHVHADMLVWAITFTVTEAPRWLKASYRGDNYTDRASLGMWDEPEPLSPDDLDRVAGYAAARDDARRRQPVATHAHNIARELDELLVRVIPESGLADRATRKTIRAIEYHLDELRRKLGPGTVA